MFEGITPSNQDPCAPTKPHFNQEVDGGHVCNPDSKKDTAMCYKSDNKEGNSGVVTEGKQTTLILAIYT